MKLKAIFAGPLRESKFIHQDFFDVDGKRRCTIYKWHDVGTYQYSAGWREELPMKTFSSYKEAKAYLMTSAPEHGLKILENHFRSLI